MLQNKDTHIHIQSQKHTYIIVLNRRCKPECSSKRGDITKLKKDFKLVCYIKFHADSVFRHAFFQGMKYKNKKRKVKTSIKRYQQINIYLNFLFDFHTYYDNSVALQYILCFPCLTWLPYLFRKVFQKYLAKLSFRCLHCQ